MRISKDRQRSRQAGVTILEILVVLTIIALLAGVVGPRLIGYLGRAKSETASLQVQGLQDALRLFYIDLGRYPTEAEGLAVLMTAPGGETAVWRGPYLDSADGLTDPWGRDYLYAEGEGEPVVRSLGRDGTQGGSDEDADLGG